MSEAQRGYFYRIALAVIALAGIVGRTTGHAIDNDLLAQISEIVGLVFGIGAAGLAVKNTAIKPQPDPNVPIDPPIEGAAIIDPVAPTDLPPDV